MRGPRLSFIGGVYHITVRCNNQEFLFKDDCDFLNYLHVLMAAKIIYRVEVYAYCLMNNHVHLIIGTPYEDNLSKFMQYVNGNFAKKYNRRYGRSGHFWGDRFHSVVIGSHGQFFRVLKYVELNFFRTGKIKHPEDWKFSSYNAHAFGEENSVIDFHPHYLALADRPEQRQHIYREMVENYMLEEGLVRQPALTRGLILGSPEFIQRVLTNQAKDILYYQKRKIYFCEDNSDSCSLYKTNSPLLE